MIEQTQAKGVRVPTNSNSVFTPDYKAAMIEQYHQSGKTQSQFCRDKGLAITTFNHWLRMDQRQSNEKQSESYFVPVQVTDANPAEAEHIHKQSQQAGSNSMPQPSLQQELQIRFPQGYAISVPIGFDAITLKRIIKVVA